LETNCIRQPPDAASGQIISSKIMETPQGHYNCHGILMPLMVACDSLQMFVSFSGLRSTGLRLRYSGPASTQIDLCGKPL